HQGIDGHGFDRNVIQGSRGRFRLEGVVPPLQRIVGEAVRGHRLAQHVAVGAPDGVHLVAVGVGAGPEVVEVGAHVQGRAGGAAVVAAQYGQVEGGAAAVAGGLGDV